MAKIDNIVINDGAAMPHTFAPNGNSGTSASYVDRATGISVGFPTLRMDLAQSARNQPLNKVRVRLSVPVLEVISGSTTSGVQPAPRQAFAGSADVTFIFHERSSAINRKDVRMLLVNALLADTTVDLIDNLAPAY